MRFMANDEEVLVRDTVSRVLSDTWNRLRRNKETVAEIARKETHAQLCDLGLMGAWLPEITGGAGGGSRMLMEYAGQVGRHQYPCSYLSSATLSAQLLSNSESPLAVEMLGRVATGRATVATGFYEPGRRYALVPKALAVARDGGLRVSGSKAHVLDGPLADAFLVTVRYEDETAICLIPCDTKGVTVVPYDAVDGTPLCRLDLNKVELVPEAMIICGDRAVTALREAITWARFAAASEILGICDAALTETLDYLRVREQFGRTLNQFQALQHRAADLHVDIEMLRSLVLGAANVLDDSGAEAARGEVLAAVAQAFTTGDTVGTQAIHMHGAIGMTRDLGVGRFLMRANTLSRIFGDLGQIEIEMANALGLEP